MSEAVLIDNETGDITDAAESSALPVEQTTEGVQEATDVDNTAADAIEESAEQEVVEEQASAASTKQAEPQQQKETVKVEDPGDFTPSDYSFDVTLVDGTVIHIAKPEDISSLPADAEFKSAKDFLEVQANYSRMVNGIESEKRAYEDSKKQFDAHQEVAKQQEEMLTGWSNELNYLESKGKLPAVPAQYQNADWSDPEVAKQPGVKERMEIMNYLFEESKAREAAGLPPMRSMLEAYNELRSKQLEDRAQQQKTARAEATKKRGAMVGGAGNNAGSSSSSDMIVGSGGSLRDLGI